MHIYANVQYWKAGEIVPEDVGGSETHTVKKIEFCCPDISKQFSRGNIKFANTIPAKVRLVFEDEECSIRCCPFCGSRIVIHPTSKERADRYRKDHPEMFKDVTNT